MLFSQANDLRSDFGLNIHGICSAANVDNLSYINRGDIKYHPISDEEKWRVGILNEILTILNHNLFLDFDLRDLKFLFDFLSVN